MRRDDRGRILAALWAGLALLIGTGAVSPARPVDGNALFEKRCGGCHALDRDKEGPRLAGVYGRRAGTAGSFPYSAALQKSGIVWTNDTLERWLTDPAALVPDTDMTFRVPRAEERKAIIGYLKKISRRTTP